MSLPPYLRETAEGVELLLLIQPRASRLKIAGEHQGRLKIQLTSPPVDGEANLQLLDFLADRLDTPKRQLRLKSGETGRRKTVLAMGKTGAEVMRGLE